MSDDTNYEQPNNLYVSPEHRVRVKMKFGDKEFEAEGADHIVDQYTAIFLSQVSAKGINGELTQINADGQPVSLPAPTSQETVTETTPDLSAKQSLLDFFLDKSPKNQRDEVLVITYYYQVLLNQESLSLEEYDKAYDQLKRAAVKKPSNMKSSVRNVVDRTPYLRNAERGKFMITLQGESLVKSLPTIEQSNGKEK